MVCPWLLFITSSSSFLATARRHEVDLDAPTTQGKFCKISRSASHILFAVDVGECSQNGNCNRFANAANLPKEFLTAKPKTDSTGTLQPCVCFFKDPWKELLKFMPFGQSKCDETTCWRTYRDIVNRFTGHPEAEHPDNEWRGCCAEEAPSESFIPSANAILDSAIKKSDGRLNLAEIWTTGIVATPEQLGVPVQATRLPLENGVVNIWRDALTAGKAKAGTKPGPPQRPSMDRNLIPTLFWEMNPAGGTVRVSEIKTRVTPQLEPKGLNVGHLLREAGLDPEDGVADFDRYKKFLKVVQQAVQAKQRSDDEQQASKDALVNQGAIAAQQASKDALVNQGAIAAQQGSSDASVNPGGVVPKSVQDPAVAKHDAASSPRVLQMHAPGTRAHSGAPEASAGTSPAHTAISLPPLAPEESPEDIAMLVSTAETVADALELEVALELKMANLLVSSQLILESLSELTTASGKEAAHNDIVARTGTLASDIEATAIWLQANMAFVISLQQVMHLNALIVQEQKQVMDAFMGAVVLQTDLVTKLNSMKTSAEAVTKAMGRGTENRNEAKAGLEAIQVSVNDMKGRLAHSRFDMVQAAVLLASELPPSSPVSAKSGGSRPGNREQLHEVVAQHSSNGYKAIPARK